MKRQMRSAAALGSAAFLVIGTSMLAFPGTAAADTRSTNCGGSVSGKVGDTVLANTAVLGVNLGTVNLGTIKTTGTSVLSKTLDPVTGLVCKVTVTATKAVDDTVDSISSTAPEPVQGATGPVTGAVKGGTEELRKAAGAEQDQKQPGGDGSQNPPNDTTPETVPPSNSPAYGGSVAGFNTLPYSSYSPMTAFTSYGSDSLFGTAPGLRYGSGFPDYSPDFGVLGEDGSTSANQVRNAGQAHALPPAPDSGIGLPMLLAVLALAGASAGLVRTWVLRLALDTNA